MTDVSALEAGGHVFTVERDPVRVAAGPYLDLVGPGAPRFLIDGEPVSETEWLARLDACSVSYPRPPTSGDVWIGRRSLRVRVVAVIGVLVQAEVLRTEAGFAPQGERLLVLDLGTWHRAFTPAEVVGP